MDIHIIRYGIQVKVVEQGTRKDNLLAFGQLRFFSEDGIEEIFKITGFTIRRKEFNGQQIVDLVFPAYRSGQRYRNSFYIPDKSLWLEIRTVFLKEFSRQTGIEIPERSKEVMSYLDGTTSGDISEDIPF